MLSFRLAPISLLSGISLLAGCASDPLPSSEMVPPTVVFDNSLFSSGPGKGAIVVKRDTGAAIVTKPCLQVISIDGKAAFQLAYGEGARVYVEPGEHILSLSYTTPVCNSGSSELAVLADPSREKTVRVVLVNQVNVLQQTASR